MGNDDGAVRLRDLGGYLASGLAPVLMPLWYARKSTGAWTLPEVRQAAREFPEDGIDVAVANLVRTAAWFAAGLFAFAGMVVWDLSNEAAGRAGHTAHLVVVDGLTAIGVFALGAGLVSVFKYGIASFVEEHLDEWLDNRLYGPAERFDGPIERTTRAGAVGRAVLARLCLPSNADLVVALGWTVLVVWWLFD